MSKATGLWYRTMVKDNTEIKIYRHLIIKNTNWEYYLIIDEEYPEEFDPKNDRQLAVVMGYETEMGWISMNELKPYIISDTNNEIEALGEIMPAKGWEWKEMNDEGVGVLRRY